MVRLTQRLQIALFPGSSLGHWDDVVYLKLGPSTTPDTCKPVPGQCPGPSRLPVPRPSDLMGRHPIPTLPDLVFTTSTVTNGGVGAARVQANAFCSGHGNHLSVFGPGFQWPGQTPWTSTSEIPQQGSQQGSVYVSKYFLLVSLLLGGDFEDSSLTTYFLFCSYCFYSH